MAVKTKTKAGSPRSPKKSLKKVPVKAVAKPTPKKAPAKKPTPSKAAARKTAKTVSAVKRSAPSKPVSIAKTKAAKQVKAPAKPVKKATPPAAAPKKDLVRKTVSKASLSPVKTAQKPVARASSASEPKKPRFQKSDLDQFKSELLAMRDRITGQSGSMRTDALQRTDEINPEEDGTDAFMRLQTLEQVSSQQQIITNIDEALRAIEKGSYGVCDACGELINKPRLAVLPFAKNCIKCQSEMERPNRFAGRR